MLPVIFLMGPTASGKTGLAMELVKRFNCEIVSVDSALIYRGMDIGTAKPTAEEQRLAPHHLIDIINPDELYSAARFREDALEVIGEIHSRCRVPLLTGGTMLYYKALAEGLADNLPVSDPELKARLNSELSSNGLPELVKQLKSLDPSAEQTIELANPQRVTRALEVVIQSGHPISWFWQQQSVTAFPYPLIQIAVCPPERAVLHQRIEQRFSQMLTSGFEEEVQRLRQNPALTPDLPSVRSVGYRQMWMYLDGKFSYEEMIEKSIIATRQLAKRQLTWLRKWENLTWFDPTRPETEEEIARFMRDSVFSC